MSCEHHDICPLREFEKKGKIGNEWNEKFCGSNKGWEDCVRYQETKNGIPHPDNKLPDGKIYEELE